MLNGSTIQKGDSFTLSLDLQFQLTATLSNGSKVLTGIKAGFFALLVEGIGWTIEGAGITASTTIVDVCQDKLEITISNPVTLSQSSTLTITTGSFTGKTIAFTVFKAGTDTPVLITKSSIGSSPGITIDSPTKARIFLVAADTNGIVIPKPKKPGAIPSLSLDYFIKASSSTEIDTVNAGTFNLVSIKKTPSLPLC